MRRRELITLLGGGAVAWPLAARAQQAGEHMRRIGTLIAFAKERSGNRGAPGGISAGPRKTRMG
jgi:hypothetical protein